MGECVVERIPIRKAMELLRKDGIEVTEGEAEMILSFMYVIAEVAVDQFLRGQDKPIY